MKCKYKVFKYMCISLNMAEWVALTAEVTLPSGKVLS